MSRPFVSVIILNWFGKDVLPACVEKLQACDPPPDEVVLVDNGSTDGSEVWIQNYRADNVVKVLLPANLGYAGGNNAGFDAAKGDVIAVLNNDAEVHPNWIGSALRHFSDPKVGMVACKTLRLEDPPKSPACIDKLGHLIFPDGMNRGLATGQTDHPHLDHSRPAWPDGSGAFYRADMLREIGFLDEDFFLYGEDAELGMRARWAGYTCAYEPLSIVYHHHSAGLGKFSPQKLYYIERNRLWLMLKTFPASLVCLSPFWTTYRYVMNFYSILKGSGSAAGAASSNSVVHIILAILKAWLHGFKGAPLMLRKRRSYPRRLTSREMRELLKTHRISASELTLND